MRQVATACVPQVDSRRNSCQSSSSALVTLAREALARDVRGNRGLLHVTPHIAQHRDRRGAVFGVVIQFGAIAGSAKGSGDTMRTVPSLVSRSSWP